MHYSVISGLALILNLIINRESLKNLRGCFGEHKDQQQMTIRYSLFLVISNCYFIADIAWGFLYEYHESDALFLILYVDTIFYFLFMFLTMLTWIRYIIAYLDKSGRRSRVFLHIVWGLFVIGLINLMINRFYPFLFSFNEKHEYIAGSGRHIAFILQIVLYLVVSIYMFYIAHKSIGEEKIRHIAVGLTCAVMDLFLIHQIMSPVYPFYALGLIIGICLIHSFVESSDKKEKEIFDNLVSGLAEDYSAMYYIDIESGEYQEFVISNEYGAMNIPYEGRDFYAEAQRNLQQYVYAGDREMAKNLYKKETMLKSLEGRTSFSYKYRVMVNGMPRFFLLTLKLSHDGKHFVLYEKDIEEDIKAEILRQENQKKQITFTQIAESLAVNYDVIYYVDAEKCDYITFESRNIYGKKDMKKFGDDFFADSKKDVRMIVHESDQDIVLGFLDRDNLITTLKDRRSSSIDYRILFDTDIHHVRLTVRKTSDGSHYIIGIENIDDEVRREEQHLKALNTEKELARRDELTGVKNKTAYAELEKSVQANIDNGLDYLPFAIVVCDANDLKRVNDTEGHAAGDEYIKKSAMLLCDIFDHSPVFRVGGDEFVVFMRGNDYSNREELMKKLQDQALENKRTGNGPVLASGMAEYVPETDRLVSKIFERADRKMYENKQKLKNE